MKRMSRAGRKTMAFEILRYRHKIGKSDSVTIGYIAKKMGIKSSTYLKKILEELLRENDQIQAVDFSWGRAFRFVPYEQTSFLDRIPVIKNKGRAEQPPNKSILSQLLFGLITEVQP